MSKRQHQKAETRKSIVAAAHHLFSTHGYGVSMRAIAERAGIAVGTLFFHFKDKHDLLIQVLHDGLAAAGKKGLESLSQKKDTLTNLLDATRPVYEYYLENPSLSQVLLKESMFLSEAAENQLIRDQLYWFLREISSVIGPKFSQDEVLTKESFLTSFFSLYFVNLLVQIKKKEPTIEQAMGDLKRPLAALTKAYHLDSV